MRGRHLGPAGTDHGKRTFGQVPEVGQLIGYGRPSCKAWRVVRLTDVHQAQWHESTVAAWEKAGRPDPDTWDGREIRIGAEPARDPAPNKKDRRGLLIYPWAHQEQWWPLRDPYPVCVDCGCLWPCPCDDRNTETGIAMKELDRLASILPGCCWGCGNPVTARHKSIVFDGENLLLPGGPPPVFHASGSYKAFGYGTTCRGEAIDYEERWVAADPSRRLRMVCPGTRFRHDDFYECSAGDLCSGDGAAHRRDAYCSSHFGIYDPVTEVTVEPRPDRSCGTKACRGGAA